MLNAVNVDERDGGWEAADPRFKVILFRPNGGSWAVDTWDLSGCGVLDAIRWAQRKAGPDGTWSIGLITERSDLADSSGIGFTYLEGYDLNAGAHGLPPWEQEQIASMLRRRGKIVVLEDPLTEG